MKEVVSSGSSSPIKIDSSRASTASQFSMDRDLGLPACRVCQCVESDKRGDAVLGFLSITSPFHVPRSVNDQSEPVNKLTVKDVEGSASADTSRKGEPGYVQFVSPNGEVFVCHGDIEMGVRHNQDTLIELGCSCKNDLALVHYACALKWFVNHGSTVCEICGCTANNIKSSDFNKVLLALKDYEALRDRTASGIPSPAQVHDNSGVDPDAVAAIRRQRLSEIYSWFVPHGNHHHSNNNNGNMATVPLVVAEQPSNVAIGDAVPPENPATKWAMEGTGILLATGLLTVTLAWLIAPRVGKKTAKNGLHILLGGVCALAVVVFFRFIVLTRIRYGPARYWAILFVFWFLVFGIWASRTHAAAHAT